PEELERRVDQAGGVQALGGLDDYTRFSAAEALRDAAKAGGDNLTGAGVGLGAGMNLGALMGQTLNQATQGNQANQANQAGPNPVQVLKQLKEMLDNGLITQAEYDTKKSEILGRM
ncbi:MAG TPA: SHOCT domain-containing protein, partial [Roseiflexaceae bacterium]|nr:SHOCT domain-containing protein [Roseiflexaceae bacterium]